MDISFLFPTLLTLRVPLLTKDLIVYLQLFYLTLLILSRFLRLVIILAWQFKN